MSCLIGHYNTIVFDVSYTERSECRDHKQKVLWRWFVGLPICYGW